MRTFLSNTIVEIFCKFYFFWPHKGIKIMEQDWDYLIVLDACRFDYFKELNQIKGELKKVISQAGNTPDWLIKNFIKYYRDIVYVSANPYISNQEVAKFKATDHFFKIKRVWDYGWDSNLGTVHPSQVTQAALKLRDQASDKRMIVHYMQPHGPYIGETRILEQGKIVSERDVWKMARKGEIKPEIIKKAYKDNLRLALKEVEKLIDNLNGRIVITADHGECLGEKFMFGHFSRAYVKELTQVPWLVVDKDKRENTEIIKERLKALGY